MPRAADFGLPGRNEACFGAYTTGPSYAYAYPTHDPSGWELCAVMNGIPALYTQSAIAYGLITGGSY